MDYETRDDSVNEDSFLQIGADLNAARLDRGIQINELSQLLRISKQYLKDIESGDFDALPGPTYVTGYLRSFAQEVGLDAVEVTQRYRVLLGAENGRPAYSFPVDTQRPQRSGAMLASIIVIFAVAGYGGWYALGKPDVLTALTGESEPDTVALPRVETAVTEPDDMSSPDAQPVDLALPAAEAPAVPSVGADDTVTAAVDAPAVTPDVAVPSASETIATVEAVAPSAAETVVATDLAAGPVVDDDSVTRPGVGASADLTPSTDMVSNSAAPATAAPALPSGSETTTDLAATDSDAVAGAQAPAPTDRGVDDRVASALPETADGMNAQIGTGVAFARQRAPDMEITLRATGASWVEIIRNDGEEVMARLMRAGETYMVDSRDRLYLSTGNAGGLELVFNDGSVRPVGDSGEILRDLLLDVVKLRNQF